MENPLRRQQARTTPFVASFMAELHRLALTGFIGERTNRSVALVTNDFRRYHDLVPFFENEGMMLLGLAPGDPVPPAVRVVIGGHPDDPRSLPFFDDREAMYLAVRAALDPRRLDGTFRRVVVGIDPGDTIGMAVLADGALFWVRECHRVEDVVQRVEAWHPALGAKQWEVHIGDGAPNVGAALAWSLRQRMPEMPVAFVHEAASSPTAPVTLSRHTDAAIHIAMREPT